ncbi:MAG: hypothetical protein N2712_02770 [Brevinematales bacterium]|nr:hypothetical protein [Brevinematales bacterium]
MFRHIASFCLLFAIVRASMGDIIFSINSTEILHYDYIKVVASFRSGCLKSKVDDYRLIVLKDDGIVSDLLGREFVKPKVFSNQMVFLFVPRYGMKSGFYDVVIKNVDEVLFKTNVLLQSRQQAKLLEPLKVLTFEENMDIRNLDFKARLSTMKDDVSIFKVQMKKPGTKSYRSVADSIYRLMLEANLNTFLMLGGQTTYLKDKRNVWYSTPLSNLTVLKYLKDKGIQTGAYVMCFLTLGQNDKDIFKGYRPIITYRNGRISKEYKFTSVLSTNRVNDIIDILTYIGRKDYIDFLGLDFIRVGDYGGYELIPEFYSEVLSMMDLSDIVNVDFSKLSYEGLIKVVGGNESLRSLFRWYQAVRVSRIIRSIRNHLMRMGISKPLVAFMLGWNAGREHGQDLFMFRDAGIDYSFYMLYEFYSDSMYESAGEYYLRYVYNLDTNIVFGNIIDSILNRGNQDPLDTFSSRLKMFITHYSYFPPNGFFIHDLYRLFNGRIKPYTTEKWLEKVKETVKYIDDAETMVGNNLLR